MRPRRFPRQPICPEFKISLAFDVPISLLAGLDRSTRTYDSLNAEFVSWALERTWIFKSYGHHAASTTLPEGS